MAINRVEIKDFLVFKGEFTADFCQGINVLIGGNATGKTTLLKVMYWGCEFSNKSEQFELETGMLAHIWPPRFPNGSLRSFFNLEEIEDESDIGSASKIRLFSNKIDSPDPAIDELISKKIIPRKTIRDGHAKNAPLSQWVRLRVQSVFIPTTEMLSHSRGFLELDRERRLPFDCTEIDIIAKAGLPPTRKITENAKNAIEIISRIIKGKVEYDGKDFFVVREKDSSRIPFSLEASGFRKFGLLWKLLRNGLLENGSVLFWDEPENSLNPELVSILVDILLELSRNGVQIFIATHSEILASYFAVNRQNGDEVMFTSLYKDGEQVKANTSDRFDLLEPNNLTAEPVKLYEKQIEKGLNGNGK